MDVVVVVAVLPISSSGIGRSTTKPTRATMLCHVESALRSVIGRQLASCG